MPIDTIIVNVSRGLKGATGLTGATGPPVDVVNDLTTGGVSKALSAQQGVTLKALADAAATHAANVNNPHGVTKSLISLGNVENTSDASKPVSTAQAAAIALKANLAGGNTFTGTQTHSGDMILNGQGAKSPSANSPVTRSQVFYETAQNLWHPVDLNAPVSLNTANVNGISSVAGSSARLFLGNGDLATASTRATVFDESPLQVGGSGANLAKATPFTLAFALQKNAFAGTEANVLFGVASTKLDLDVAGIGIRFTSFTSAVFIAHNGTTLETSAAITVPHFGLTLPNTFYVSWDGTLLRLFHRSRVGNTPGLITLLGSYAPTGLGAVTSFSGNSWNCNLRAIAAVTNNIVAAFRGLSFSPYAMI